MTKKYKLKARVVSQVQLAPNIYSMWLECFEIAQNAQAGQFIGVYPSDNTKILMRPISLCEIDAKKGQIRIVYRVTRENTGTDLFSKLKADDTVEIFGPLGNGFDKKIAKNKTVVLVGGGIGIPPLLELGKCLAKYAQVIYVLGYRDLQIFLAKECQKYGQVYIATQDGSLQTKGTVMDVLKQIKKKFDLIYACGPTPMLKALQAYAKTNEILCYLSLEERMACGIGACLACVCQSLKIDEHSHVYNKRVCKDGPIFLATEVKL